MIGIGLIGAGHFGAVHARAIAAVDHVHLVAVCREDPDGAAAFAARHGGRPYSDWRALLADRAVDAVVIATPHHLHTEIAIAAAEAGKHILLEKPMAPTVAECDAINAAVTSAGVTLTIGHVMHFALPCLKAREVLASGRLGRPVLGSSWMVKLWMEENRRPWHLTDASGGGMLMTAGIHALDRLIWLMGGDVAGVQALADAFFHDQPVDDSALLLLRFADGRIGQVASVGYREGAVSFAMDLVCENGTLRIDFDRGVEVGVGAHWTPIAASHDPAGWMQRAVEDEWRAFAGAIRDGSPAPVDGRYGRAVIATLAAAAEAARLRREIAPA